MKHTKILLAGLLAAPALVFAQVGAGNTGMTYEQFNQIDQDGSGTISEAEYFVFMDGAFKQIDKDGNNSLSRDETANMLTDDQFAKVDVNGNSRISRQEFLDHVMSEFHYHDANKDGELHP